MLSSRREGARIQRRGSPFWGHECARNQAVLNAYLITLTGLVLAQIAPGPNILAVAGAALGQGRRSALFVSLGVASASFTWVAITALGFGGLLTLYPSLLTAMKLLGGGYLVFLGAKSLAAAIRGREPSIKASVENWTPLTAWRRGFLVNVTSPMSALWWSGIASFLYGSGLSTMEVVGFAPIAFLSSVAVNGTYGVLISSGLARRSYARFAWVFEVLFGLVFGALGGKLVADGVAEVVTR